MTEDEEVEDVGNLDFARFFVDDDDPTSQKREGMDDSNTPLYSGCPISIGAFVFLVCELKMRFRKSLTDSLLLAVLVLFHKVLPAGNLLPIYKRGGSSTPADMQEEGTEEENENPFNQQASLKW